MLRRLLFFFEDFFGISPREARGALALLVLSFFMLLVPTFFRKLAPVFFNRPDGPPAASLDSLAEVLRSAAAVPAFPSSRPAVPDSSSRIAYFVFDPNAASIPQMQQLGFPPYLAQRIDKYRGRGGKFRKADDLLRIYGFPEDLFARVRPYVRIRQAESAKTGSSAPSQAHPAKGFAALTPFDINTADTVQLQRIRGIGSKLAQRIVRFRDGLGGFHNVSQLQEVFGLSEPVLEELYKYCRVESPVQKVRINEVSYEGLLAHTYLRRERRLVGIIIHYRQHHGSYLRLSDLLHLEGADPDVIRKMEPYLDFR